MSTATIEAGTLSCTMIEPSSVGVTCNGVIGTSQVIQATVDATLSAFFQFDVFGFTNPPSATPTATFQLNTFDASGVGLDEKTENVILVATAGSLASITLTP